MIDYILCEERSLSNRSVPANNKFIFLLIYVNTFRTLFVMVVIMQSQKLSMKDY